ncbi:hypothetical protein B296_00019910 [Ensete ventricosum]|uniref:CRAL-TRIO domain-containing protein n=1 Tax=Ensete ventricosum TaxID=4639 RepID=A0A426ZJE7_ENSVE|nr:hypothetical protein B296_00019910 [Ensete ventricosum]
MDIFLPSTDRFLVFGFSAICWYTPSEAEEGRGEETRGYNTEGSSPRSTCRTHRTHISRFGFASSPKPPTTLLFASLSLLSLPLRWNSDSTARTIIMFRKKHNSHGNQEHDAKDKEQKHEVATESETGKLYRANFHDREGRTIIVMRPAKQCHYPERLAVGFLYNPPRIFETFWKVMKYFLDPKTFLKAKFIYPKNKESMELMRKHFDLDVLPVEFGGRNQVQYNHEEFSKMMIAEDTITASFWSLEEKTPQPEVAAQVS